MQSGKWHWRFGSAVFARLLGFITIKTCCCCCISIICCCYINMACCYSCVIIPGCGYVMGSGYWTIPGCIMAGYCCYIIPGCGCIII